MTKSILIVDDNLADTYLLQKTLHKLGVANVHSVSNAEDAAKYIVGLDPFVHRYLPDAVFVDLKLPAMGGLELIAWLSNNPLYKHIPLVVFSGSSDNADRERALALGARAYYQKTQEAHKLHHIVTEVLQLTIVPPRNNPGGSDCASAT